MDSRRKYVRLTYDEIPDILKKPILLYNYKEVRSRIENLSPLGVGLIVDSNSGISTGDIFYLKYYTIESDIKCICVYCEIEESGLIVGAYFTDSDDQKTILKFMHSQETE